MYQTCACVIHINLTHCQLHVALVLSILQCLRGVHVLREALVGHGFSVSLLQLGGYFPPV